MTRGAVTIRRGDAEKLAQRALAVRDARRASLAYYDAHKDGPWTAAINAEYQRLCNADDLAQDRLLSWAEVVGELLHAEHFAEQQPAGATS